MFLAIATHLARAEIASRPKPPETESIAAISHPLVMFALTSKPAVAAAKVRLVSDRKKISAHAHRAASVPRRGFAVTVKATAGLEVSANMTSG